RTPSECSKSLIERETTGCETESSLAAFAMLPDCATAKRICRSLSLIRRPMRSFQRMIAPLAKLLLLCKIIELFSYSERRHFGFRRSCTPTMEASMLTKRSFLMATGGAGFALAGASPSWPLSYPQRGVKIVVAGLPGVAFDLIARAIADKLSAS